MKPNFKKILKSDYKTAGSFYAIVGMVLLLFLEKYFGLMSGIHSFLVTRIYMNCS